MEQVSITRDGTTRLVSPEVAKEAVRRYNYFFTPEPPKADPSGKSLSEVKAEIKAMTDPLEVQKALDAEKAREAGQRQSVLQLCESKLANL